MPSVQRFIIGKHRIPAGERRDLRIVVSQRYNGDTITLPVHVIRAKKPGPKVFVTAAVHGDELNGMGVIHDLMFNEPIQLIRGTLVLVPAVNIFGLETNDRYMPDRRDLNRFFPGSENGSLTSRFAHTLFHDVLTRCDFGIDLHTAASYRTNYPNVRGDMRNANVRRIARAFGCELIINGKGPEGSLRREITKAGCPTIILEAGEPLKIEPGILQIGIRGVRNVLKSLDMMPGIMERPVYQTRVDRAIWVRAESGGILRFHVSPGDMVRANQPIATNVNVFGHEQHVLLSPVDGIVLGMTTLPTVKPGEPVCQIVIPNRSLHSVRKALGEAGDDTLYHRLRHELRTNITVTERESFPATPARNED